MIQIDIDMPRSCNDCPIQGETFHCCPLVPGIPAWQREISENCADKRSEHCPLIDCTPIWSKLKVPDCCGECESMFGYQDCYVCHMPTSDPLKQMCDVKSFRVEPDKRPDWCPIVTLNNDMDALPPEKREKVDAAIKGLSALFGPLFDKGD